MITISEDQFKEFMTALFPNFLPAINKVNEGLQEQFRAGFENFCNQIYDKTPSPETVFVFDESEIKERAEDILYKEMKGYSPALFIHFNSFLAIKQKEFNGQSDKKTTPRNGKKRPHRGRRVTRRR